MKASELITLLQDAVDKYGDLPILTGDYQLDEVEKVDLEISPWTNMTMKPEPCETEPDFLLIEAY